MSLDLLFDDVKSDFSDIEIPLKKTDKVRENIKGLYKMSKIQTIKSAFVMYLLFMGAWQTTWNVYSFLRPEATTFKNLKGMEPTRRAYMEAYLDACSMGNYFENKMNKCEVAGSALATLIKGESVIADIGLEPLPLSKTDQHKTWEQEAEAGMLGKQKSPGDQ